MVKLLEVRVLQNFTYFGPFIRIECQTFSNQVTLLFAPQGHAESVLISQGGYTYNVGLSRFSNDWAAPDVQLSRPDEVDQESNGGILDF